MASRELLQQVLEMICPNVYFQPPANVQMEYPAIVYQNARSQTIFADNAPYHYTRQYDVTIISRNPDESIHNALASFPMCTHDRSYPADNLNHSVFSLYF